MALHEPQQERSSLAEPAVDSAFWLALVRRVHAWSARRGVALRDALVLLPYAQLLDPARRAFAEIGGWQPRIETTRTLAGALAPAPHAKPGQVSGDAVADRLVAAALLRRELPVWPRRDPRGFEQAVAAVVETAQGFVHAAAAMAPIARADWWRRAREALRPLDGPGGRERALAQLALEWAALGADAPGRFDGLFALRPSAWIVVQAGGVDPLAAALCRTATATGTATWWIDTDAPADAPFDTVAALPPTRAHAAPRLLVAEGLEGEARACTQAVIEALERGARPVALVAHDRVLVRRVRALLERAGVTLHDETGWKLSTTRAAARVMGGLRAAHAAASADDRLDWLKGEPVDAAAVAELEARLRRGGAAVDDPRLRPGLQRLRALADAPRQPLAGWLQALREVVLDEPTFAADAAGRQVAAALRLDDDTPAWQAIAASTVMDLDDFTAWVDTALESGSFVPPHEGEADVVVTPLARLMLRPFAAAVMGGTDASRLDTTPALHPLLSDPVLRELGLPDASTRRNAALQAFVHLLRLPGVVLLRRRADGAEPLAQAPWVERWLDARRRAGFDVPPEAPARTPLRTVAAAPVRRPAPAAPTLPASLSASAVESLRQCPYRFFVRVALGLGEIDELDAPLDKRDWGSWLHAALHGFHAERTVPAPAPEESARLLAWADRLADAQAMDPAQLLPWRSALAQLAPLYVEWLHAREAEGWHWTDGEVERRVAPTELQGTGLHGRLDRIDRRDGTWRLVDYKTGAVDELRRRARSGSEDTQLAFYTLLVREEAQTVEAQYLVLDERRGPQSMPHPEVAASAAELLAGLAGDLAQVRAGAGLAALGEGPVCERCEARGVCRRDHWSAP